MHSITLQAYSGIFFGKPTPIEKGDRVILPQSILESVYSATSSLNGPLIFKITNPGNKKSIHCGVLEFSPQAGKAFLPWWMMKSIHLSEGDKINLDRVDLPNGTFVQLQPHDRAFQQIDSPKAILESIFRRFATLSEGSTITIHYQEQDFSLTITKTKPGPAINIINTDLSVDFLPLPEDMSAEVSSPKLVTPGPNGPIPTKYNFIDQGEDGEDDEDDSDNDDEDEDEDYFASMKVNRIGDLQINVKPLKKTGSIHTPLSPPRHLTVPDHQNLSSSLQSQGSLFFDNMRKHATASSPQYTTPIHTINPEACCFNCYKVFESEKQLGMHETQCVRKTWRCFLCGDMLERAKPLLRSSLRGALNTLREKRKSFDPKSTSASSFPPSPDPSLDPPNLTDPFYDDDIIKQHIETVHKRVNCDKCGTELEVAELISHQNLTCPFRDIICQFCGVGIRHNEFKEHTDFCGSRSEKCYSCGELVLLRDRDFHLESGCSKGKLADKSPRAGKSMWICPFCKEPQSNDLSLVAIHVLKTCQSVEREEDGRVSESVISAIDPEFLAFAGISLNPETHSIHSYNTGSRGPSTISSPIISNISSPILSGTSSPTPDYSHMTDDERLAAAIAASLNIDQPSESSEHLSDDAAADSNPESVTIVTSNVPSSSHPTTNIPPKVNILPHSEDIYYDEDADDIYGDIQEDDESDDDSSTPSTPNDIIDT